MSDETRQDGSQYIDGVFVAFATLGQQIAALNNEVERLQSILSDPASNGGYVEIEVLESVRRRNGTLITERDAARAELAQAQDNSWDKVQYMLNRAGVTQVRRGTAQWYVYSIRTPRCGTGETLLAAIADLDDDTPEVPA